jgi:putative DNA modification/repair radical SAM protein
MDRARKLHILADSAKYDASCASSGARRGAMPGGLGSTDGTGICHSYTPDGRCVSLLKILLTNFCIFDCQYCVNRISNDVPRARFSVAEVVDLTLDFYRRNYIEGLFLSSGIIQSPDYTMELLVAVARTLRQTHRFGGYIHLKLIPGASSMLVGEAGRWADRVSANIEMAVERELIRLAPEKRHAPVEETMAMVREHRSEGSRFAPAGQSTQLIVGAAAERDADILALSSRLYREHGLRRVYYSAFSPFPGGNATLPNAAPPLVREHRLYQADWLIRFYGFHAAELTTDALPDLDLSLDPKLAWALRHPEAFPVDVNTAARESLLRVPGLGRRTVERLLTMRRWHRVTAADLTKLRVPMRKARPFLLAAGSTSPARVLDRGDLAGIVRPHRQLSLLEASMTSLSGEL